MFKTLQNTFCGYTWTCSGAEDPWRIENKACNYSLIKSAQVNVNHGNSVGWATGSPYGGLWFEHMDENYFCIVLKNNSFRKLPQLSKRMCDYFSKKPGCFWVFSMFQQGNRSLDSQTSGNPHYSLDHWFSIWLLTRFQSALYLIHVSSGDFTTVEMNAVERTLNNSCSQSLARKRDSWKLESCFPNISVQVEFNWCQTSVCWNISILHYRGRNHPKSRVQVLP